MKLRAYYDGFRAGKADRLLGVRNEYAWNGYLDTSNIYSLAHCEGYQRGWRGEEE